ncbi:hypothetical protein MKW94_004786, partial [Papaver nudicaule]|nr:hypothetical protein [Papaver nudicaule]
GLSHNLLPVQMRCLVWRCPIITHLSKFSRSNEVSIMVDNSLCPAHSLIQILCMDHKGLLYDMMRTLKDYNRKNFRRRKHVRL